MSELFFVRRVGDELEHGAVDAVALVGGRVESFAKKDVTQVAVTVLAADFGAGIAKVEVGIRDDILSVGGIVE